MPSLGTTVSTSRRVNKVRTETCEKCGKTYFYEVSRIKRGTAFNFLNLDKE